jgi:hypothetical protein
MRALEDVAWPKNLARELSVYRCCRCSALGWLRTLVSPVFFTRDALGNVQRGIHGLPADRPLLFVGAPKSPTSFAHSAVRVLPSMQDGSYSVKSAL